MVSGRCLCGTVRWAAGGDLSPLEHCHCSMCRKAHGAAFATITTCAAAGFAWLAGEETVGGFQSSAGVVRRFCRTCGSAVPGVMGGTDRMVLPVGCLDDDPGLRGGRHVFAASKASWHTIADALERHDLEGRDLEGRDLGGRDLEGRDLESRGLGGRDLGGRDVEDREAGSAGSGMAAAPGVAGRVAEPGRSGVLRGSCLCGGVAFEIGEPFMMVRNCHCSRCRKARGAAHATNGFVPIEALRFVRGEDLVTDFSLPGARVFGQAFCSVCGSGMPRRTQAMGRVNVPMGALDDPTGARPADHIFVGSKARWYEIADALPQHAAMPA